MKYCGAGLTFADKDIFITSAPLSAACLIAFATAPKVPSFDESKTFSGIIFDRGETPAIPMLLFAIAAIVPETCVP